MRDADYLAAPGQVGQFFSHHLGHTASDAGIDLIKHNRLHRLGPGQNHLESQHNPGQLTSGGNFRQGF